MGEGASKLGQQASQAGRSVNTFAEKNNVNTPILGTLAEESAKAARILHLFVDKEEVENGFDTVIPVNVIKNCKGLAIFTVLKAGFLWSGKVGTGMVVARLPDGRWSAPSAIATGGIGFGFQVGADITDVVLVLNSDEAVEAFCKGGNVTVGGNLAVSLGPVGAGGSAQATADFKSNKVVPMYSYTKSKGLFAGVSLEGTGLIELSKSNQGFYNRPIKSVQILKGEIEPAPEAQPLYEAIQFAESRDPY
ncbi:DUF500-domain-containing protein [Hesseltinella vesiculosa]|uniref:DUF500-domain-containing protein n=1 Tax=Hesseltinella vesiculosa TaxID=101127 RepID=A0A1X2GRK7_9FUNG|nr:DUF500-domain-containing protein [Hesseltinella vesiculosa]